MQKDKAQAQKPALWEQNPQLTAAILGALDENPRAQKLSQDQKLEVVELALRERRYQDPAWLDETLFKIESQGSLLNPNKKVQEVHVSRPAVIRSWDDLEEILTAHADWIRQVLEPGHELGTGRANLKGNDLRAYCLEGVDLRSANLEGCDLSGCSLLGANLAGCNLSKANLKGADLRRARLRRANLNQTNLEEAQLQEADLRQASFEGTNFEASSLQGAKLDSTAPKKLIEMSARV